MNDLEKLDAAIAWSKELRSYGIDGDAHLETLLEAAQAHADSLRGGGRYVPDGYLPLPSR